MNGWWAELLKKTGGSVQLLANMCGVTTKTLNRWQDREIRIPDVKHRKVLRGIAGEQLLKRPDCPKYLQIRKAAR
jgi:hypothetical protein